ncbi:MAG: signal peptidase II [Synechococcus sp.]|nr:signal peptidase II [Synechococcus sp.]
MPVPNPLNRRSILMISLLIVLIDQGSKTWVRAHLPFQQDGGVLIPGLLRLHWTVNDGAAFSLFSGATAPLGLLSFLVGIGIVFWISKNRHQPFWQGLALALLLGGTIGNGIDRWSPPLHVVTDFLKLVPFSFPIFNGADVAINLAVACFAIDALTQRHEQPPR